MTTNEEYTSIIKVNPHGDTAIMELHREARELKAHAELVRITDSSDLAVASDDLSVIAKLKKALEDKRKEYIKPLADHTKAINAAFAEITTPILEADKIMRSKVLSWQQEQERIRAEQERINRLKAEAEAAEMELTGTVADPVEYVTVNAEVSTHVKTDAGAVGQRTVKKWRLVDFALLPDSYKLPDSTKITKLVKGGGTIAGIEVYDEPILTVTAKNIKHGEVAENRTGLEHPDDLPF